jgi:16S rRNA processing protein RimM
MRELDSWIEAGAIVRPHGLRGEVVVDLKSDLLELVVEGMEVRVTTRKGEAQSLAVEEARGHQGRLIVKFADIDSREDAESVRAWTIWMTRDQVGSLEEDRWFVQDIIGLEVFTRDGEHLGAIVEVMHMPANDVYVVRGGGEEILLPAIEDVVQEVDIEAGRMLVQLIEGLRGGTS